MKKEDKYYCEAAAIVCMLIVSGYVLGYLIHELFTN
jgi:hypothetical protein